MGAGQEGSASRARRAALARRLATAMLAAAALAVLLPAATAFAGQASTGTLLFYPCTKCHPVSVDASGTPSHPLPVDFKGHGIKLEAHDVLGQGDKACLVCHDDAEHNPGMLHAVDGTLIDVKTGDISKLCQKCHFQKYDEFVAGVHGKHMASCVAAGCHDPHTPNYIYISPLPPFFGTGIQVKAVGLQRVPFKPVMQPAVQPPTVNPTWFVIVEQVGWLIALALIAGLVAPAIRKGLKR